MVLFKKERKKKAIGLLLFLKASSWEADLWDLWESFTFKNNAKLGREICMLLKIDKVETKCGVQQIFAIICVTYVQKDF